MFGKKKNESHHDDHDDHNRSRLDRFEEELTVLEKDEMQKVEGGKSSSKSLSDFNDLRNSFSGPTPL